MDFTKAIPAWWNYVQAHPREFIGRFLIATGIILYTVFAILLTFKLSAFADETWNWEHAKGQPPTSQEILQARFQMIWHSLGFTAVCIGLGLLGINPWLAAFQTGSCTFQDVIKFNKEALKNGGQVFSYNPGAFQ